MKTTDENPLAGLNFVLESTAEQIAAVLREAILTGRLEQGVYLRETPLANRFGVSRNTVREATHILIGEGLVTREMHRGAFVSQLGPDDVRDLYRVRRIVELEAIGAVSRSEISALQSAVDDLARAIETDDTVGIVDADLRFHRGIVEAMSSPRLGGLFGSVQGELRLCLARVGGPYKKAEVFLDEHQAIVSALDRSDATEAGDLLRAHLDDAERDLLLGLGAGPAHS